MFLYSEKCNLFQLCIALQALIFWSKFIILLFMTFIQGFISGEAYCQSFSACFPEPLLNQLTCWCYSTNYEVKGSSLYSYPCIYWFLSKRKPDSLDKWRLLSTFRRSKIKMITDQWKWKKVNGLICRFGGSFKCILEFRESLMTQE